VLLNQKGEPLLVAGAASNDADNPQVVLKFGAGSASISLRRAPRARAQPQRRLVLALRRLAAARCVGASRGARLRWAAARPCIAPAPAGLAESMCGLAASAPRRGASSLGVLSKAAPVGQRWWRKGRQQRCRELADSVR